MLTKVDLQAIDKVVSRRIRSETPVIVRGEIQKTVPGIVLAEIQRTVPQIIQKGIQKTVPKMVTKQLKPIHKKLDKIITRQEEADNFLDEENLKTVARVKRIDSHLGI